jgi:hypothetical protein
VKRITAKQIVRGALGRPFGRGRMPAIAYGDVTTEERREIQDEVRDMVDRNDAVVAVNRQYHRKTGKTEREAAILVGATGPPSSPWVAYLFEGKAGEKAQTERRWTGDTWQEALAALMKGLGLTWH